jgi:hypothetical protein
MDKLHFDRNDYSVVVKNRAPPSKFVEMGDFIEPVVNNPNALR